MEQLRPLQAGARRWCRTLLCAVVAGCSASCSNSGDGTGVDGAGQATRLAFLVQPTNVQAVRIIAPPVTVAILDHNGKTVTSFADTVTVALAPGVGSPNARLLGTRRVKAVAGIATFDDIMVSESADGYRLVVSARSLTNATTDVFSVYRFSSIVAGGEHFCVVTEHGAAYCWGRNSNGELGDGTTSPRNAPVRVSGDIPFDSVTAGEAHSCALTRAGAAYCWGRNDSGQLGDGTTTNRSQPVAVVGGIGFRSLEASGSHTCGLTSDGTVYCWGWSPRGAARPRPSPTVVSSAVKFVKLAGRLRDICGFTAGEEIYCWDAVGLRAERFLYATTSGLRGLSGGFDSMCYWRVFGTLICWSESPAVVTMRDISDFTMRLSVGAGHTCSVTQQGEAFCWGANAHGQVGDGTRIDRSMQFEVTGAFAGFGVFKIAAGQGATCAIALEVYCWGSDASGQLGIGGVPTSPPSDRLTPTRVRFP